MADRATEEKRIVDNHFGIIAMMVIVISVLHYTTPTEYHHYHELFRRLYYLPIIHAAYRYGFLGGVVTSVAVSFIYLPHVIFQWAGPFLGNLVRFTEIILYIIMGAIAGFLSGKVQKERDRYKTTADKLEASYQKLESQTIQLSEMESQLRTADRLAVLGELSASLAHEVRNPLGSIKGASDILKNRCSDDEVVQEFTQLLLKEVERLNRVVENYLGMAKKAPDHIEKADLTKEIQSVLEILGHTIRKNHIQISCRFAEQPQMILMQDVEVRQVFLNILLNAISAVEAHGRIEISTTLAEGEARVKIQDTGKGIEPEQLQKIFNPFFTSKEKGTGLGLAIVKRIMESHGGHIEVKSEKDRGTHVMLRFKLAHGSET
jgi:two-component system sensor histidine kinase HydH